MLLIFSVYFKSISLLSRLLMFSGYNGNKTSMTMTLKHLKTDLVRLKGSV